MKYFTSETHQNDPSESESRKVESFERFCAKSAKFSEIFEIFQGWKNRIVQQRLQFISSWLFPDLFADLSFKNVST